MFIITLQFLCKKATVLIGLQLWNSVMAKRNSAKTTDLTLEQANMLNFTSAKKTETIAEFNSLQTNFTNNLLVLQEHMFNCGNITKIIFGEIYDFYNFIKIIYQ